MDLVTGFFGLIEDLTWGWALIPILVVFGVFITVMSGFVQIEFFPRMFRVLSSKNQSGDPNAISAREALLVSGLQRIHESERDDEIECMGMGHSGCRACCHGNDRPC